MARIKRTLRGSTFFWSIEIQNKVKPKIDKKLLYLRDIYVYDSKDSFRCMKCITCRLFGNSASQKKEIFVKMVVSIFCFAGLGLGMNALNKLGRARDRFLRNPPLITLVLSSTGFTAIVSQSKWLIEQ